MTQPENKLELNTAEDVLARLKEGNRIYVEGLENDCDLSQERIVDLCENGQHPFATVITCADSRVVPEYIFSTGLGELFVIRVAGNVVGSIEEASSFYSCAHLHTKLLLVLGHTNCGAVQAAIDGEGGAVAALTDRVSKAIGDVKDPYEASVLNTRASMAALADNPNIAKLVEAGDLLICAGIYHTDSGVVEFL